jgi:4-amino-4-deoxy-L-arabinose transferase-like glycosyltransferase
MNKLIPARRLVVISFLFVAALAIRLYRINTPPLDFHATRQYRSFIIARAYYFNGLTSIPAWEQQVASFSRRKEGILEPPIFEFIVSLGYQILGGEQIWFPRLLSSLFWLIGGWFLYLIGQKIADADTALFATAFYLFLPFAVVASRSFQPDPLMIMLMMVSLWAILRYQEIPSDSRLLLASAISSLAFIVKPGSVFVLIAAFLSLLILQQGVRRAVLSRAFLIFAVITITPTILIYLYGTLTGSFLVGEAEKTLLPQLWFSLFFWRSWITNIDSTVGFIPLIVALFGLLMFREGLPRTFMLGLWIGYGFFGMALNYNFATHDYYQLQFIPIVGLSIAPVVTLVMNHLNQMYSQWYWRLAGWGILAMALLLSLIVSRSRLVNPYSQHKVDIQQQIGAQVGHTTKTVFLSGDYGVPLEYHGLLSGFPWPLTSDLEWEQLAGVPVEGAQERFNRWFAKDSPKYFIIEDMTQFEQQPDLKEFLMANYPILVQNDDYMIFSLSKK